MRLATVLNPTKVVLNNNQKHQLGLHKEFYNNVGLEDMIFFESNTISYYYYIKTKSKEKCQSIANSPTLTCVIQLDSEKSEQLGTRVKEGGIENRKADRQIGRETDITKSLLIT